MKKIFSIALLLLFLPMEKEGKHLFEIVSIKHPKEITIPKDWKGEKIDYEIEICYKYNGEDIEIGSKCITIAGRIFYYTKKGKLWPKRYEGFVIGAPEEGVISRDSDGTEGFSSLFTKNKIYCIKIELDILSKSELEEPGLFEAVQKKDLSKIVLQIDEFVISWWMGCKENRFRININKKLKIKVKYEK